MIRLKQGKQVNMILCLDVKGIICIARRIKVAKPPNVAEELLSDDFTTLSY